MNYKYIIAFALIVFGFSSCDDDFENKFDQLPDDRMQATVSEYKNILTSSEFGWKMTYSLGGGMEYMVYNVVHFNENNTVSIQSKMLTDAIESEYKIFSEADVELVFNTFNENLTAFSYPKQDAPDGFGGDIEFNFSSISEDQATIVLEGKVYKGKMKLEKADRDLSDFSVLQKYVGYLSDQRTKQYMNVAITSELGTQENPMVLGLDLSSLASAADFNYNYEGELYTGRKMLYFDHDGMGLSTPIEIDGHEIQYFSYNQEKKRYEIAKSDIEGYLYTTDLPMYYIPGVYDEFMNKYSLRLRASFGKAWDKYIAMKTANKKIKKMVICTDYKQRIPILDEDGNYVYDKAYNHDYTLGNHLGEGILFAFDDVDQFYFYFVPLEIIKLNEDRIAMKRKSGDLCIVKEGEDADQIAKTIANNPEFNELVEYLCNESGWYIRRTVEDKLVDWDFISQANSEDYFYTRLY